MLYRDLREMERLLWEYERSRPEGSTLTPAVRQVLAAVSRQAGQQQHDEPRLCSWCGKGHHDRGVDLCDGCTRRKVEV